MSDMLERHFYIRDASILARMVAFLQANWEALAKAERPLVVHIFEYDSRRTKDQNARYWSLLQDVSERAWFDGKRFGKDIWHESFRRRFLPLVDGPDGTFPTSTTGLSVRQMSDYMEQIEAFAASELGLEI